jgi:hypothetical protein
VSERNSRRWWDVVVVIGAVDWTLGTMDHRARCLPEGEACFVEDNVARSVDAPCRGIVAAVATMVGRVP